MVDFSPWVATVAALGTAFGLVAANRSTRSAAVDAFRCVSNRPALVVVPMGFAVAYQTFQGVAQALLHHRSGQSVVGWILSPVEPGRLDSRLSFDAGAALAAVEHVASVGNELVPAFPLSAGIAVFVLIFRTGWIIELIRAVRKRFPGGWILGVFGLGICGACAVVKPGTYLFLPELIHWSGGTLGIVVAAAVNVCSMLFEMFVGTYVTVALMLVAFAWIRGLSVDRTRLHRLAARRMAFALRWSLVTMAAGFVLFGVPLFLSGVGWIDPDAVHSTAGPARLLFSAGLIAFFPVLTILVFHNGSLRFACRESVRVTRRHALEIGMVLGAGWVGFFVLNQCRSHVDSTLGFESFAAWLSAAVLSLVGAAFAGWLLTAWVCLYRRLGSQAKPVPF